MVLQKLWVSQNVSRISRVSQSRFLAVMYVLQSRFFIRRCLGVAIFCKAKGLEVPIRSFVCFFVCFNDAFSSLDIEFH